jgi:hypothetical protein
MSTIEVRDEGHVRWIGLNRPDKRNAIDQAISEDFGAALEDARRQPVRRRGQVRADDRVPGAETPVTPIIGLCQHCLMDQTEAQAFAEQWVSDWNAHDVDALLAHFTDDVVFTSPVAIRVLGGDGIIRGKEALRKYWSEGIRLIPDLHFEVLALYVGIGTLVINYRNESGGVVSEVLTFDGPLVREGHGTYLSQPA